MVCGLRVFLCVLFFEEKYHCIKTNDQIYRCTCLHLLTYPHQTRAEENSFIPT